VHVIVRAEGKVVEIQVRTSLQHVWAELSEKLSDVVDPAIKYGGGDESFVKLLATASEIVVQEESGELLIASNKELVSQLFVKHSADPKKQNELVALQREIQDAEKNQIVLREKVFQKLQRSVDGLPERVRR
jgi:ppGpp synthetase/RelA/SpoT-type nucleotidyltranferase